MEDGANLYTQSTTEIASISHNRGYRQLRGTFARGLIWSGVVRGEQREKFQQVKLSKVWHEIALYLEEDLFSLSASITASA